MRFDYGSGIVIYKAFCRDRLVRSSEGPRNGWGRKHYVFVYPKGTYTYYLDLVHRLSVGYGLNDRASDFHKMKIAMMVCRGHGHRKEGQEFPPYDTTEKEFYKEYPKAYGKFEHIKNL